MLIILIMLMMIMGICSSISTKLLFIHCSLIEVEFESVIFCGGRKPKEPRKNHRSKNENQQQTQPTYQTWARGKGGYFYLEGEGAHFVYLSIITLVS